MCRYLGLELGFFREGDTIQPSKDPEAREYGVFRRQRVAKCGWSIDRGQRSDPISASNEPDDPILQPL